MSTPPFVHLHCHSHYSLLDGAGTLDRLLDRAKELGMNSLALTDHGNLHGALEFYQKANARDIKPIVGYEAYIAPESRFKKEASSMKQASFHLTLLAMNRTGFDNLLKMASSAYLEGFYFRPRIDKKLLQEFGEGLICLSGCASGEISRAVLTGKPADYERAKQVAAWYRDLFGDRYYLEIQDNGIDIQRVAMEGTVRLAEEMGLPLVATSDVHYVNREDAEAQDVLICINTGKFRTDTKRMRMEGDEFYLRSPEDMYAAFPNHEEAVRRSQEIADRTELKLNLGERHFPVFHPPDDKTSEDYLYELCLAGLKSRYAKVAKRWDGDDLSEVVMARLNRELGVINKLGFPNYFLIVWDFVQVAHDRGIETTARGSGVGSIVCYALGMSHVCPLEYDLLFERFLDENREEAPDIDIDFCQQRRMEIIDYVKETYGMESVAQIGTFGTLAAKAAIRSVGRVLGLPISRVNEVCSKVPDQLKMTIAKALETSDELKQAYDNDGEIRELLDLAQSVEGLAKNVGTHAAAVVIADCPLTDYVALGNVPGKKDVITQWAMNDVEAAGLLKMDFLGLRNLTILSKVVDLIEQTTGERVDPYEFPLDDKETFALLCRGETKGIFQLESGGIRDLLQRMKPDSFQDVIATAALYRPGPLEGGMVDDYIEVKHGRKKPTYKHPVMEEILAETNGVMVYQEQVMRILNQLGGIQLANAYKCIKAISKKKLAIIAKFLEQFLDGAQSQGLPKKEAEELFTLIEKFAGYGFNKSHSTAYALIAYMTAYLKAHYKVEFMAGLLCGDVPNRNFTQKDSTVEHLEDCQRMEIEVVPPSVNTSQCDYAVGEGKIYFGLSAIKGCGVQAADAIHAARKEGAPFRSLFDFCERVDPQLVNRSTVETLIKAGAFDEFGAHRSQLTQVVDRALQTGASAAADRRSGQMGLFDSMEDDVEEEAVAAASLPDIPEWEERDKLTKEKQVLGYYLSSHPLAEYQETLSTYCSHNTVESAKLKHRTEVMLGGMLSAIKFSHTKNPKPGAPSRYAMFDLEDMAGMMRCILWPDSFVNFGELVQPDAVLVVIGSIDKRPGSEEANLIVNELLEFDDLQSRYTRGVKIRVMEKEHGEEKLKQLHEILRGYPGKGELQMVIYLEDGRRVPLRCKDMRVEINKEMWARVEELLGPGNFKLLPTPLRRNGSGGGRGNRSRSRAK